MRLNFWRQIYRPFRTDLRIRQHVGEDGTSGRPSTQVNADWLKVGQLAEMSMSSSHSPRPSVSTSWSLEDHSGSALGGTQMV